MDYKRNIAVSEVLGSFVKEKKQEKEKRKSSQLLFACDKTLVEMH